MFQPRESNEPFQISAAIRGTNLAAAFSVLNSALSAETDLRDLQLAVMRNMRNQTLENTFSLVRSVLRGPDLSPNNAEDRKLRREIISGREFLANVLQGIIKKINDQRDVAEELDQKITQPSFSELLTSSFHEVDPYSLIRGYSWLSDRGLCLVLACFEATVKSFNDDFQKVGTKHILVELAEGRLAVAQINDRPIPVLLNNRFNASLPGIAETLREAICKTLSGPPYSVSDEQLDQFRFHWNRSFPNLRKLSSSPEEIRAERQAERARVREENRIADQESAMRKAEAREALLGEKIAAAREQAQMRQQSAEELMALRQRLRRQLKEEREGARAQELPFTLPSEAGELIIAVKNFIGAELLSVNEHHIRRIQEEFIEMRDTLPDQAQIHKDLRDLRQAKHTMSAQDIAVYVEALMPARLYGSALKRRAQIYAALLLTSEINQIYPLLNGRNKEHVTLGRELFSPGTLVRARELLANRLVELPTDGKAESDDRTLGPIEFLASKAENRKLIESLGGVSPGVLVVGALRQWNAVESLAVPLVALGRKRTLGETQIALFDGMMDQIVISSLNKACRFSKWS